MAEHVQALEHRRTETLYEALLKLKGGCFLRRFWLYSSGGECAFM
jgi:hypothetical protein